MFAGADKEKQHNPNQSQGQSKTNHNRNLFTVLQPRFAIGFDHNLPTHQPQPVLLQARFAIPAATQEKQPPQPPSSAPNLPSPPPPLHHPRPSSNSPQLALQQWIRALSETEPETVGGADSDSDSGSENEISEGSSNPKDEWECESRKVRSFFDFAWESESEWVVVEEARSARFSL
jgi:hypothetical protein